MVRVECCAIVLPETERALLRRQDEALTLLGELHSLGDVDWWGCRVRSQVSLRPPDLGADRLGGGNELERRDAIHASAHLWVTLDIEPTKSDLGPKVLKEPVMLYSLVEEVMAEFAVVLSISFLGFVALRYGVAFVDGSRRSIESARYVRLLEAWDDLSDDELLAVPFLTPRLTLPWLRNTPGYREGVGMGKIGRACSAFAHLHRSQTVGGGYGELAEVAWAIVGLEALFGVDSKDHVPSGGGVQERIARGVSSFLSDDKAKETIRNVYRQRSRTLHGEKDLPYPDCWPHSSMSHLNRSQQFSRTALQAAWLLARSLQKLAAQNANNVPYNIDDSS